MVNLNNKKILLLAPPFYSLHNQIIDELTKLGAKVGYIPDIPQRYNPYYISASKSKIKNKIRHLLSLIKQPNKQYLSKYHNLVNDSWDYFICIDGYSFDNDIINILNANNRNILKVLYLWDSINFYNFKPLFKHFDNVFTFDRRDSELYKLQYLPLFWIRRNKAKDINVKYDISFIGSNHTDRMRVLNKIDTICKQIDLNTKFKIVIDPNKCNKQIYDICTRNDSGNNSTPIKNDYDFLTFRKYSESEIQTIIDESNCILDIVKPDQNGLSNRTIQALASKKKIITTNPSYIGTKLDNGNIMFINRNNPVIDIDFIKNPYIDDDETTRYLEELRIDKWLLTICSSD